MNRGSPFRRRRHKRRLVIARADVGAAMGGFVRRRRRKRDVVIMDDNPEKLAAGIRIARRTMRIVRTNVALALASSFWC